jgi:uncharacterized membrane protein
MLTNRFLSIAYLMIGVFAFIMSIGFDFLIPNNLLYFMICVGISVGYNILDELGREHEHKN